MPAGLEVQDGSGNVVTAVTDRLTVYLGQVAISANTSGSVTVPTLGTNEIAYYFVATTTDTDFQAMPSFSISGDTISWTSPNVSSTAAVKAAGGVLQYGRY